MQSFYIDHVSKGFVFGSQHNSSEGEISGSVTITFKKNSINFPKQHANFQNQQSSASGDISCQINDTIG